MTFEELRKKLGDLSTESKLSDVMVDNDYLIAHIADLASDNSVGAILVRCDDGIWAIPYDSVVPHRGFEQLEVRRAVKMEGDDLLYALDELKRRRDALDRWIARLDAETHASATDM